MSELQAAVSALALLRRGGGEASARLLGTLLLTALNRIELALMTLTSMIGVATAQAMKGGDVRIADLAAAAETLGLRSSE